ncbi:MAG: aminopeptidase P family protein, partial [bacterium]
MFAERLRKLQVRLHAEQVSFLLVSSGENIFYLTGLEGLEGYLLIGAEGSYLFTDSRYEGAVVGLSDFFSVQVFRKQFTDALQQVLEREKVSTVHYEAKQLTVYQLQLFKKAVPAIEWKGSVDLVERLREQKDEEEIRVIKKSCALLDSGFAYIEQQIAVGMKEKEVAWKLEQFLREQGGDALAFPTIIGSGSNSAVPHHHTSDRVIEFGDIVLVDAGVRYKGYCSDCSRTYVVGESSARFQELYSTVLEAQELALQKVKAGEKALAVDAAAREYISKAGFEGRFGHGTGHGVGIAIHERPRLSPMNTTDVLLEGSVVTVEPGIYVPDFGGVRIEDT